MIDLTTSQLILLVIIIFLIGIFSNIAGFGGAVFVIPVLTVLFDVPVKTVIGSALSAIALPAFFGFIAAWRRKEVDFTIGILLEIPTVIGVIIGASATQLIDDDYLRFIFSFLLFIISFSMIRSVNGDLSDSKPSLIWEKITNLKPIVVVDKKTYSYQISIPFIFVMGLIIGFVSGLLGLGGGWLKMPILIFGIGLPPIVASGTALFMLVFTSITGGFVHYSHGNWDFELSLIIMISLTAGALIGDRIKQEVKGRVITLVSAISLFLVGLIMLFGTLI